LSLLSLRRTQRSTLFPYTTLFRSKLIFKLTTFFCLSATWPAASHTAVGLTPDTGISTPPWMLVLVTRDQMRPTSSIFSTIRFRIVVGMTAPMSEGNVVSSARNSRISFLTPRVTYSMNARRYSTVSYRSTARGSTVTFCTAVESTTRTSGDVPASMLAATSRRRRSSFSSSASPFSSFSSASKSTSPSFSSRPRISALRASIPCRRLRRFMFSHSLQVGLKNQLATPLLSRLRGPALGLRLRHEVAPRADIGILVRRGIHRRDVPDALEPQNTAGSGVAGVGALRRAGGPAAGLHARAAAL